MDHHITVLYFAQTAELTGTRRETWEWHEPAAVKSWRAILCAKYPALAASNGRLKIAVNQHYASENDLIQAGDEVAVFEPVTGG